MKKVKSILLLTIQVSVLFALHNCTDPTSDREVVEGILLKKSWKVYSVVVPMNTATDSDEWMNFLVYFSKDNMYTSGYPKGAEAVWFNASYSLSEDGKSISREDGVVMSLINATEASITIVFSVPEGTRTGGRIAALEGEYVFNLQ